MSVPILGYWHYRGLGEPIRYMLHYLGVKYEDKKYTFGPAPNYNDCLWLNTEKTSIGLDFPNLPYYFDGDLKLTQSNIIMRYLSRKHGGLYLPDGKDQVEALKFDMADGHVQDIAIDFHIRAYQSDFEQNREAHRERSRGQLKAASDYLANKTWFMGDSMSHIDFMLYEGLDIVKIAFPGILDEFPNLVKFHQRFASIPSIKMYLETAPRWPLLAPRAGFGGRGEMPKH